MQEMNVWQSHQPGHWSRRRPSKHNNTSPIIHPITFCRQHHCVRGRVCDAAGAVAVAAGAGAHQVGGRLHQLVPPHADPTHHHRPLPRRQGGQHGPLPHGQVNISWKSIINFPRHYLSIDLSIDFRYSSHDLCFNLHWIVILSKFCEYIT